MAIFKALFLPCQIVTFLHGSGRPDEETARTAAANFHNSERQSRRSKGRPGCEAWHLSRGLSGMDEGV